MLATFEQPGKSTRNLLCKQSAFSGAAKSGKTIGRCHKRRAVQRGDSPHENIRCLRDFDSRERQGARSLCSMSRMQSYAHKEPRKMFIRECRERSLVLPSLLMGRKFERRNFREQPTPPAILQTVEASPNPADKSHDHLVRHARNHRRGTKAESD